MALRKRAVRALFLDTSPRPSATFGWETMQPQRRKPRWRLRQRERHDPAQGLGTVAASPARTLSPWGVSRRVWGHCHRWRWGAPGVWGCGVQRVTLTESHPALDISAVRLRGRDVAGSDLTGPELQSRRDAVSSHWAPPTSPRAVLCAGGCGGRRRSTPLPTRFSSRRMKTPPPRPSSGSATTVHGGRPRPPDRGQVLVCVLVPLATGPHSRRRV